MPCLARDGLDGPDLAKGSNHGCAKAGVEHGRDCHTWSPVSKMGPVMSVSLGFSQAQCALLPPPRFA